MSPNAAFQSERIYDSLSKEREYKTTPRDDENKPQKCWNYAQRTAPEWRERLRAPILWSNEYKNSSVLNAPYDWVEDDDVVVDLNVRDIRLGVRYPEERESYPEERGGKWDPNYKIFDPYPCINAPEKTIEQAHILAVRPAPSPSIGLDRRTRSS